MKNDYNVARKASFTLVACFATAWLAGCGSSQTQINPSSQLYPQAQTQNSAALDEVRSNGPSGCSSGPLKVNPCDVHLARRHRSQQISVSYPPGNTVAERNSCRRDDRRRSHKRDVAKLHGGGENWTVTAGDRRGFCKATFTMTGKGPSRSVIVEIRNSRRSRF